jgi:uncharacterized membrane-anchored protein
MVYWRDHDDRAGLIAEVHARPRPPVPAPASVSRIDLFVTPEEGDLHLARLRARLSDAGRGVPESGARHHVYTEGPLKVVFERHTEFVSYTVFDEEPPQTPFKGDPLSKAPSDAFTDLPGGRLSAVRLHIVKSKDGKLDEKLCEQVFGRPDYAASALRGGAASLAADFEPDTDGYMRFLAFDSTPADAVRGRMVQRILEMEAYRMAAMLALPLARETGAALNRIERAMDETSDRIAAGPHAAKDRDILQRLTRLAGEAEQLRARGDYRFAAARAYGRIVDVRAERLRADRIEGHERIGVFIERRLQPALRTCEAVASRQQAVAERVDRAVRLLATRVQVDLEEQNKGLLDAMNRRAEAQLRLQETVEALSAVAITYYAVSLIYYLARGGEAAGLGLQPYIVAAIATPVIFLTALFGVRFMRQWLKSRAEDPDDE